MTERWHCHKAKKPHFSGGNEVENAVVPNSKFLWTLEGSLLSIMM